MIKNSKQLGITKKKLSELIQTRSEFEQNGEDKKSAKYRLGINSLNSLIEDLESEIKEYEALVNGNFHCLQAKSLIDLPKVLIAGRIAQKMTHKQLGELLGLKEQQIQRYESTDYESASFSTLYEVAMALQMEFNFKEEMFVTAKNNYNFEYPDGITTEQAAIATEKVKSKGFSQLMAA